MLLLSYWISVFCKKPLHWGMPFALSIEPTTHCNLACPECPTGNGSLKRTKSEVNMQNHNQLIDEIGKYLFSVIYYFQGEPFLNNQLYDLIKYASNRNIYTITSTNGHFLNQKNSKSIIESGLNKLIVSIDGVDNESYTSYRKNGSFEKVVSGIKTIIELKKQLRSVYPIVELQFLVLKSNEHQIDLVKKFANDLGADNLVFKTAQFYDFKKGNPLMPESSKFSRYKKAKDGSYQIKSKLRNRCWRMWSNPVITVSGDIAVCCFDKDAAFKIGNVFHQTFKKVWKSADYKNFRKRLFQNRKEISICTNCTEGLPNVFS